MGDPVIFEDPWAWLYEEEEEEDRKSLPKRAGGIQVHKRGKQ